VSGLDEIQSQAVASLRSSIIWDKPLSADDSFLTELERYVNLGATVASINTGFADMSWTGHLRTRNSCASRLPCGLMPIV
jgi:hypothetical protein